MSSKSLLTALDTAGKPWRCRSCGKQMGLRFAGRLHIRFSRGHEYITALPATATCRGCKTLNALE